MYLKKKDLMAEYSIGRSTVDAMFRRIQKLTGKRYPDGSVIHTGEIIRVRDDVFYDIMRYGDAIDCGVAPEFVPHEKHTWERDAI